MNIERITSKDVTGREVLFYMRLHPVRGKMLNHDIKNKEYLDMSDYGEVLASCFGTEPTEHVRKLLKEKYNYDA